MYTVVLVIHVLLTLALIGVILVQRSASDGFGMGSGSGANILSGAASKNLLTRATSILAASFIGTSLLLGILHQERTVGDSIIDQIEASETFDGVPVEDAAPETSDEVPEPDLTVPTPE